MIDALLTVLVAVMILCLCGVMLAASVILWIMVRRLYRWDKELDQR